MSKPVASASETPLGRLRSPSMPPTQWRTWREQIVPPTAPVSPVAAVPAREVLDGHLRPIYREPDHHGEGIGGMIGVTLDVWGRGLRTPLDPRPMAERWQGWLARLRAQVGVQPRGEAGSELTEGSREALLGVSGPAEPTLRADMSVRGGGEGWKAR